MTDQEIANESKQTINNILTQPNPSYLAAMNNTATLIDKITSSLKPVEKKDQKACLNANRVITSTTPTAQVGNRLENQFRRGNI